jgi:Uma2 family endonuclease
MIRGGILQEGAPVELLDGRPVWKDRSAPGTDPMTHDPRHALCVTRLQRLFRLLEPFDVHVRLQLPVTLSEFDEPEPDAAIVKGQPEAFADRHPGPADVVALVEVADSSVRLDRTTKLRKYAQAAIPQYWLVNLPDRRIEVYTEPVPKESRYSERTDCQPGQSVTLVLQDGHVVTVQAAEILPG